MHKYHEKQTTYPYSSAVFEGGKELMSSHDTNPMSISHDDSQEPARSTGYRHRATKVTQARAKAQRVRIDQEGHGHQQQKVTQNKKDQEENTTQQTLQDRRRARMTVERAIDDYLDDHVGGNHSEKTLEWHRTALGLLRGYLKNGRDITLVGEIDAPDIVAWFTYLRKIPGARGKMRSERTVQTYARSARAFFHWLVRQETITSNPFERVAFPKVGKPLIKTISDEEFEQLLLACAPPHEEGPFAERAAVRNRSILWLFYDSGIRLSELINLRLGDFDRKHGLITVKGKGSKERRIALGQNCLRNLLYYLDRHRPDERELEEWGSLGEDHVFLAETRKSLTKNGVTLLFMRLKKRAGITGKRISPHIFRHTFAIRYLKLGKDPFSLQELLGHEDMATVKLYMHMNDDDIQEQKRKYSPGDYLPASIPGPRETRRRGYTPADQKGNKK
jgi:integrase/recombinase XerD